MEMIEQCQDRTELRQIRGCRIRHHSPVAVHCRSTRSRLLRYQYGCSLFSCAFMSPQRNVADRLCICLPTSWRYRNCIIIIIIIIRTSDSQLTVEDSTLSHFTTQLFLKLVTVIDRYTSLRYKHQPCIFLGSLNRVPSSAGVKVEKSLVSGGK